MTYHGNVTVGGPPAVRELAELVITKVAVGPYDNNAYLLRCRATDEQLLVDAANDAPTLLGVIGGVLGRVVTTHQHGDHWQALADVVAATGARTAAGRDDVGGIPVPPVHRRLPGPGGPWTDNEPAGVLEPDGRPGGEGLRPVAGRDLDLPGPRQRYDARRRAPPSGRVARARLVAQPGLPGRRPEESS
jgi:glyoxylase-like metal-dependent hydrolase (beta-lactamase superfamily II)